LDAPFTRQEPTPGTFPYAREQVKNKMAMKQDRRGNAGAAPDRGPSNRPELPTSKLQKAPAAARPKVG
jgi:hypothetical protein